LAIDARTPPQGVIDAIDLAAIESGGPGARKDGRRGVPAPSGEPPAPRKMIGQAG